VTGEQILSHFSDSVHLPAGGKHKLPVGLTGSFFQSFRGVGTSGLPSGWLYKYSGTFPTMSDCVIGILVVTVYRSVANGITMRKSTSAYRETVARTMLSPPPSDLFPISS